LKPLLAGAPEMRGAVTANLALGGTAAAPLLDGRASITALSIAGQPYDGLTASAHYASGAMRAQADFRQDASHQLTATADAPMVARWDPAWSASSTGDAHLTLRSSGLSLAVLNAFAGRSVQKIGGELAADVTATGPFERLRPNGTIELRDGAFTVPEFGTSISEGTILVRFDPARARIEKLFARGVDGTIEGSGVVPYATASSEPMNLTIEAKNFRAASSHRYRADIEGRIAVGGTTTAPKVSGRVEVLDAALRPDIAFLGKAPKPRDETIKIVTPGAPEAPNPATAAPPPVPKPDAYQNSTIDVVLAIHRNTWIRHEEAAVDLEGEVRATKPPGGDLALIGEVHTVHGWAVLQGRRFTLARGSIAFTGGKEIDPSLDVVADYKKGEYLIHAIVSGTANAPALTLASEPELEQADVISVLLFGKPSKDLNDGQKSDLKAKATEMAGAYAFTEIGQSVSRALGLESKGVQVEELSTERLALGTYLTDKTYVTLGQNIGDRQGQEVAIQYEFVPHWSVETSTSTVGGSGMDLIWHRNY
jgi:translocation and assembly module TamB